MNSQLKDSQMRDQSSRMQNAYLEAHTPNDDNLNSMQQSDLKSIDPKQEGYVNKTDMYEMFEISSSASYIEENKSALLGEGISEQLVEDIVKIANSFDKLRRLYKSCQQSEKMFDRELAEGFELKF